MTARNVYVAAAYGEKSRAAELCSVLASDGHRIVSTWQRSTAAIDPTAIGARRALAQGQYAEVTAANAVIVLSDRGNPRGTFWEAGVAYEQGSVILWVGEEGPIFDALADRRIRGGLSVFEIADHFAQLVGLASPRLRREER